MSKKTLIIPDVHNRWELFERIVKYVKPDLTICLGDHFDDFNDDPHVIVDVADWFHWSVNQPNRIHIVGNHDIHYWFKDNDKERSAGYDQAKSFVINDFVTSADWKKLVFYYNLDNKWLLSHAGLHPSWLNPDKFKKEPIISNITEASKYLRGQSEAYLVATGRKKWHWFGIPGFSRCNGSPYYGGLLWCDWDNEFWPIRGLNQIVGHTPKRNLSWIILNEGDEVTHRASLGVVPKLSDQASYNICLDSVPGSSYYGVYEDGKLSINLTADLK